MCRTNIHCKIANADTNTRTRTQKSTFERIKYKMRVRGYTHRLQGQRAETGTRQSTHDYYRSHRFGDQRRFGRVRVCGCGSFSHRQDSAITTCVSLSPAIPSCAAVWADIRTLCEAYPSTLSCSADHNRNQKQNQKTNLD